jgi:hypothetical protein
MTLIYSKRLAYANGANPNVLVTVPAGKLWVIKSVVIAFTGASGGKGVVYGAQDGTYLAYAEQTVRAQLVVFELYQPLPAGEQLGVQATDAAQAATVRVSGYEFSV